MITILRAWAVFAVSAFGLALGQDPAPKPPAGQPEPPKPPEAPKPPEGRFAGPCDRKSVRKAPYCATCAKFPEPSDVLDSNFCKKCNEGKKPMERVPLERRWACIKYFYSCEEHKIREFYSAHCPQCKKPFSQNVDRAEIKQWKCTGCSKVVDGPSCPNEACQKEKTELEAVCPKSGTFPHVPE